MRKHTPGPWKVHHSGNVLMPDGEVTALPHTENRLANARLIAAAPEMLEVLREILFRSNLRSEDEWIERKAIAAISKATEVEE